MSQLIDHTFVITGNDEAIERMQQRLEALQNEFPGADGIMEWGQFERTPGHLEFYFFDSHYFVSEELAPRLADWSNSEGIVIQQCSWTDDGELGAWVVRTEKGKAEEVAGWDWPHPAEVQELLLSLEEAPTASVVAQLLRKIPEFLDGHSSGVGIAEVLMETFEDDPELTEDADVRAAMLEIEEQEWSDEDIEDVLFLDDPEQIEPLLQLYRLREVVMMKSHLPPGKNGEVRAA